MNLQRGDVALALYPFASGAGHSRCPVVVIQSDAYNKRIRNTIVAQITTNLTRTSDPAHLLIDISSPDGKQSGLLHNSVVSCLNLVTLTEDRLEKVIGRLPNTLILQMNACLKAALGIP